MKTIKHLLIIVLVLFSIQCSSEKWEGEIYTEGEVKVIENKGKGLWEDDNGKDVLFEENLSLGQEEGEDYLLFYKLRDLAVDSSLNIYVVDAGNHRIIKFDKEGKYIWQTGRKGQGPGEFQFPRVISISPKGEIAVGDGPRIHYFNKQGEYLRSIRLEKDYHDFQFLPNERLLASIDLSGRPGVTAEYYSVDGEFIKKFPDEYRYGPEASPDVGASIGGGGIQLLGNKIYFSLPDKYEIRKYDLEGNLLSKIKRNVKLKPPNIKIVNIRGQAGVLVGASDCSGPCYLLNGGYLINCLRLVGKIDEEKFEIDRFLDFFNKEGRFLKRFKYPEGRELITNDSQNNFYFIQTEPFPKVIRATLKID